MTALLLPDEAARLRVGEQLVIVRPGDEPWGTCDWGYCQTVSTAWRRSDHPDARGWLPVCDKHADESSVGFVAPQDWVALTGPHRKLVQTGGNSWTAMEDGRRIEPLYTECPECQGEGGLLCCDTGLLLSATASIEVVPVVGATTYGPAEHDGEDRIIVQNGVWLATRRSHPPLDLRHLNVDPLPIPGRDFGIIIDCVEVAP